MLRARRSASSTPLRDLPGAELVQRRENREKLDCPHRYPNQGEADPFELRSVRGVIGGGKLFGLPGMVGAMAGIAPPRLLVDCSSAMHRYRGQ